MRAPFTKIECRGHWGHLRGAEEARLQLETHVGPNREQLGASRLEERIWRVRGKGSRARALANTSS